MKKCLVALLAAGAAATWDACETIDGDCPACPLRAPIDTTTTMYITDPAVVAAANASEQVILERSSSGGSDIIRMEDLGGLHTSLDYLCCHTPEEELGIASLLSTLDWRSIDVHYADFGCNLDHDGSTIYLHAMPDEASQTALMNLTTTVQDAMEAAGIPVNHPRKSKFHMTLARVTPDYDVDGVVDELRYTEYGTVRLCRLEFLGKWFYSPDCSPPSALG